MRRWWLILALLLPLAGCPEKKSDNPSGQPDSKPAEPTGGGPSSDRALPGTPSR